MGCEASEAPSYIYKMSSVYDENAARKVYPDIDTLLASRDPMQFRLDHVRRIQDHIMSDISERERMSKVVGKYAAVLNFIDKSLVVLSTASGGISIASFATAIGAPVGIASASIGLIFALSSGFVKKFLAMTTKKKYKHRSIALLARSKLNTIDKMISKAIQNSNISDEEFRLISDEAFKYDRLKDDIRMGFSNRVGDFERENLLKQGQQMGANEIITRFRKASGDT